MRKPRGEGALEVARLGGGAAEQRSRRQLVADAVDRRVQARDGRDRGEQDDAARALHGRDRGDAPVTLERRPRGRRVRLAHHDLQRACGAVSERPLQQLLPLARAGVAAQRGGGRHPRPQPQHGGGEEQQDRERGGAVGQRPRPEARAPGGEALAAVIDRTAHPHAAAVDPLAQTRQHRREQRQRRGEHHRHGEPDADRDGAKRRDRDERERQQRGDHGEAAHEDRLARGRHRDRRRVARGQPRGERGAEADDDEERVVDAERDREHHREVHRPDRDVGELPEDEQRPARPEQAGHREQQRQAGRDERAEREHQQHERQRPGEQLGLEHRRLVLGVEVRPHRGGSGEADGDAVRRTGARGGTSAVPAASTISSGLPPARPRTTALRAIA